MQSSRRLTHSCTKSPGVLTDSSQVKEGASKVSEGAEKVGLSKENPLGLAIGGAAAGFLVGMLLPSTRIEDDNLGEVSDEVVDRVKETGQDAFERGKQVAQETLADATGTMIQSGTEQARNVADELKETARDVAQTGSNPS